jgi:hypothetical protein
MERFEIQIMKSILLFLILGVLSWMQASLPAAPPAPKSSQNERCLSCHQLDPRHSEFGKTPHGRLDCGDCHRHPLSSKFHRKGIKSMPDNLESYPFESIRLSEPQLLEVHQQCRQCHEAVFDQWNQSGHSMSYGRVFLDREHNRLEPPMNDCLRCHGMFWGGDIADLVLPLATTGPWHLSQPELERTPAIPCLACHEIHPSAAWVPPGQSKSPHRKEPGTPVAPASFGFYDRREKLFFNAVDLPHPKLRAGGKDAVVSSDLRQRICYQCHAADATHQMGTSDDRTPGGVHAGLNCADCHQSHSLEAMHSCARCHPRDSHCGLDVRLMDTTARSAASAHDIHRVACGDCHQGNRPATR